MRWKASEPAVSYGIPPAPSVSAAAAGAGPTGASGALISSSEGDTGNFLAEAFFLGVEFLEDLPDDLPDTAFFSVAPPLLFSEINYKFE